MEKYKKYLPLLASPAAAAALILLIFKIYGLYPFGEGSVAWCDMIQQSVPLLIDFKDILSGKDGLFLNMHNAGGMNFFGVFFFFLSNPFSFLAAFVEKQNMILFVNILVLIKLTLCALTASVYFTARRKKLGIGMTVLLSLMYAFCGYGLMFYQNIMWLDVMYMFPLLMIGMERLTDEKKNILYIITLSAIMVMNYYLCYMAAVFILLYMGIFLLSEKDKEHAKEVCVKFISGTVISAMMTAIVWLTSFMQFKDSARQKSVIESIRNANFLSKYQTVLPLLFCSAFIFSVIGIFLASGEKRNDAQKKSLKIFALMLLPFFIEPINLMWHTGSYMAFPARYGYITVFAGLICCADIFESQRQSEFKLSKRSIFALITALVVSSVYFIFSESYITKRFEQLTVYTNSLWGDNGSFSGLAELFVLTLICYSVLYIFYRKNLLLRRIFLILTLAVCVFESAGNMRIYMTSSYVNSPDNITNTLDISGISDKIDDDEFYRVGAKYKITDYNMMGALGYNSLSHYTSLTDENYLFLQKKLGYTTVWMEAGPQDGTELTNGLYSVKYKILYGTPKGDAVYSKNKFYIEKQPYYVGLGLVCDNDFSESSYIPPQFTRAQVQQYVFSEIFGSGKKLVTEYPYDPLQSRGIQLTGRKYDISKNAKIEYNIKITGKQSLYVDCFDRISTDLSEAYFDSLTIKVNGVTRETGYPQRIRNGTLNLGEFENETVTVTITSLKDISCYSFGVFGLDLNLLEYEFSNTQCADLNCKGGKITGNTVVPEGKTCFLAIPYNDGLTVKINGEKVPCKKVLSGFTAFDLTEGSNDIEITLVPKGFIAGSIISVVGTLAFGAYIIFQKKFKPTGKLKSGAEALTAFAALLCFALIYVLPIILIIILF